MRRWNRWSRCQRIGWPGGTGQRHCATLAPLGCSSRQLAIAASARKVGLSQVSVSFWCASRGARSLRPGQCHSRSREGGVFAEFSRCDSTRLAGWVFAHGARTISRWFVCPRGQTLVAVWLDIGLGQSSAGGRMNENDWPSPTSTASRHEQRFRSTRRTSRALVVPWTVSGAATTAETTSWAV